MEKRELPKVFALTIYNYGFLKILELKKKNHCTWKSSLFSLEGNGENCPVWIFLFSVSWVTEFDQLLI